MLNKHEIACIYFGVKPNGDVGGQDIGESTLRDVSRTIYETIKPQIYPIVEKIELNNKNVIKVEANGIDIPYSSYGKYYIRVADEDKEINPNELQRLFDKKTYLTKWEKKPSNSPLYSIDKELIRSFYESSKKERRLRFDKYNETQLLKNLGLVTNDNLNNAGRYLFGMTNPLN